MILSEKSILEALESDDISITPFDEKNLKQASYTLTLGILLGIPENRTIDSRGDTEIYQEVEIGKDGYELQPGAFVIAQTAEDVNINENYCAFLTTRGSRARMGLNPLQSDLFIEPGSSGKLSLALTNVSDNTIVLHSGITLVKCIFHQITQ